MYSRSLNEPRPRMCIHCKEPEVCKACTGTDTVHMCGNIFPPTREKMLEQHQGEFVLDGFDVVKLITLHDDGDDLYWIYQKWGGQIYFSSAVGAWAPLKGEISDKTYNELKRMWKINYGYWPEAINHNSKGNNINIIIKNLNEWQKNLPANLNSLGILSKKQLDKYIGDLKKSTLNDIKIIESTCQKDMDDWKLTVNLK